MDSIFVLINHIDDPTKKKALFYLVNQHRNVILASDIYTKNKIDKINKMEFVPWLMIKNNGEGIFLVKKIIEKFEPWVTIKLQHTIYKHDIPEVFWGMEQWSRERERKYGKIQLRKK